MPVAGGDTAFFRSETHLCTVTSAFRCSYKRTVSITCISGKTREVVCHSCIGDYHLYISTVNCGFPFEPLCGDSHVVRVGNISVKRSGGGGNIGGDRSGDGGLHLGCGSNVIIAETADGKSVALVEVAPEHVRACVEQEAVVGVARVARVLRSTPEVGAVARVVERRTVAVACRNGGKPRGIIRTLVVPNNTSVRAASPSDTVSQRLGDITGVPSTYILALAAHIVGHRCPLRITRQMPTHGTDAPAVTGECHRYIIVVVGVHAGLPVGRVECIHRRVPIVQ